MKTRPRLIWDALGLSATMTGIERLAAVYTRRIAHLAPDIEQSILVERHYEWLPALDPAVAIRYANHVVGGIGVPRIGLTEPGAAYHTWGHGVVAPLSHRRSLSATIHDWTPFERVGVRLRHRVPWQAAVLENLWSAGTLHLTIPELGDQAPSLLRNLLSKKRYVVGTGASTWMVSSNPQPETTLGNYILVVGTMVGRKRQAESVALWKLPIMTEFPRLILVGGGTEAVGSSSRHLGLGYVGEERLVSLMNGALAVLSLSDREGLNLPAREALALGRVVVGTAGALGGLAQSPRAWNVGDLLWDDLDEVGLRVSGALRRAIEHVGADGPGREADESDGLSAHLVTTARQARYRS